ncbi:hypothetical protein QNI16_14635 [Cytophagaceae bacterium YF14B1]|uniref:Uncharacterized protein n=1 Tax=Xanthocytophaga flava TaxID=3048013 RepID=A0AAE3QRY2_9BACT|nr:hypothetical protein [Xanthocytophaga flavus]MDJ1481734.1 hypothetical protein [Xanthocytophaga flavus]
MRAAKTQSNVASSSTVSQNTLPSSGPVVEAVQKAIEQDSRQPIIDKLIGSILKYGKNETEAVFEFNRLLTMSHDRFCYCLTLPIHTGNSKYFMNTINLLEGFRDLSTPAYYDEDTQGVLCNSAQDIALHIVDFYLSSKSVNWERRIQLHAEWSVALEFYLSSVARSHDQKFEFIMAQTQPLYDILQSLLAE